MPVFLQGDSTPNEYAYQLLVSCLRGQQWYTWTVLTVRRGRPIAPLTLTDNERTRLEQWSGRRTTASALALRSRIVLAAAAGENNRTVAERLRVTEQTVGKWRRRFLERRLDGLSDEPRPGVPPTITDAQVEWVIAKTLEETPRGATQWSTRSMAEASGLSRASVWRIWRAFGLQPHRVESFKLSTDPFLVAKVRDIVGLYLDPPERGAVLCVDEKSPIQALERTQPLLPMRPGVAERRSHDYYRHGTTSLFAAYDVITGQVTGKLRRRHRSKEFGDFLRHIEEYVPEDLAVHLILDNYATHKTPTSQRWLLRHPRFHLHFTPAAGLG